MARGYREWLQRDVAEQPPPEKPAGRAWWENWWHYNRWYLVGGVVLAGIAIQLALAALGAGKVKADVQVAYVGRTALSDEAVQAVSDALAAQCEDLNGDGRVIVTVNQYITQQNAADADTAMRNYGTEVTLIADIAGCESYFFLLEDPADFQKKYALIADAAGRTPEAPEYAGALTMRWADIPALKGAEVPAEVYFCRRCFYAENKKTAAYPEGCADLWERLAKGAVTRIWE